MYVCMYVYIYICIYNNNNNNNILYWLIKQNTCMYIIRTNAKKER